MSVALPVLMMISSSGKRLRRSRSTDGRNGCRRWRRCRGGRGRACRWHRARGSPRPPIPRRRSGGHGASSSAPAGVGRARRPSRSIRRTPSRFSSWRDLQADGGLGEVEPVGRGREAAALDHFDEGAELVEVEPAHVRTLAYDRLCTSSSAAIPGRRPVARPHSQSAFAGRRIVVAIALARGEMHLPGVLAGDGIAALALPA